MRIALHLGRRRWGAAFAGSIAALLLAFSGSASAGIADTRHNLGSGGGPAGRNQVSDTAEICVFCHTPHGASTTAPAPLWNKQLRSDVNGYTSYASLNTPSLDGTIAPVGSVSLACLSCHDGTQAMDNIINAPGSGGYNATGGGAGGLGYDWGTSPRASGAGVMTNVGEFISMLGEDLSNDHPIGIQYCGGGLTSAGIGTSVQDAAGTCKDLDFVKPKMRQINGNDIFWVDTGVADKQRTDLPLYVRATNNNGATGPLVECASCHDPHVSGNQTNPGGMPNSGETFLRISNASSAVCTACHVK